MKTLLWAGVILGSLAIGIFGYAVGRYCNSQKEWSEQREAECQNASNGSDVAQDAEDGINGSDAAPYAEDNSNGSDVAQDAEDDSNGSDAVRDAEDDDNVDDSCVICLTRRRIVAFIPCGHLVCCQQCVFSFGWQLEPKCPVCRHPIWNSMRIYES